MKTTAQIFAPARAVGILLVLVVVAAGEPVNSNRLFDAGRLWAHVQFTHPWLAIKDIDWDRAFVEAAPKILAAQSQGDYEIALKQMLQTLNDPATHLQTVPLTEVTPRPASLRREQEFLVLDTGHASPQSLRQIAGSVFLSLEEEGVKGLIVDARQSPALDSEWREDINPYPASGVMLFSVRWSGYPNVGLRPKMRDGFRDAYHRSLDVTTQAGSLGRSVGKPVAILASKYTRLPPALLALHFSGKAILVLEGEDAYDAAVPQIEFKLSGGLTARIRTHEFLHSGGTYGFVPAEGKPMADALATAISHLKNGTIPPVADEGRLQVKPLTAPPLLNDPYPSEGVRLLGILRTWSAFEYFFPYKHLIGEDWNKVLLEALIDAREAKDAVGYHLAVAKLAARTNDSHSTVYSPVLDRYWGASPPPFEVGWVEDHAVVTKVLTEAANAGVRRGDVLLTINGRKVQDLSTERAAYLAASTVQYRRFVALQSIIRAADGAIGRFTFETASGTQAERSMEHRAEFGRRLQQSDQPVFRNVSSEVGYVDLTRLEIKDVDAMFEAFRGFRAIILDMRGYPRGTGFALASRLARSPEPPVALFRQNQMSAGEVTSVLWTQFLPSAKLDKKELFTGRTILLINESAVSQSEHLGLACRAANQTLFVGQPTAGANGGITPIATGAGLVVMMSGQDIRWPDGRELQRAGLQPDIPIAPTIAGVRAGRDEVLDKAIEALRE